MKKTLLLFPLLLPFLSQAQLSLNVSKKYPAHIVCKIDDVLSKVKLDEETQIKIANKFQKFDSIANVSLAQGASVENLKSFYKMDISFLQDIVSTEELEQFAYQTNKDNRFLAALNSITYTKLKVEQINKIRQLNDSLNEAPKKTLKETIQFQNWKLNKILDKEQYVALLKFIYKDQSLEEAKTDWQKILKLKINTPGKESEEFRKIADYHFSKNSFLDKKADRFEKTQRDFLSLKATTMEPPILIRANILSNQRHANNKYASIIQYEKELDLSQQQIDTLLAKYLVFEKIIIENRENDLKGSLEPHKLLPSEFENIAKIISPEQTNKWLSLKNKNEAIKKSKESWAKLEAEGLSKDLDKEKTTKDLTVYHLRYLVAAEKAKNWKTPESRFLVRDAEQKKPEILLQLEAINRSKVKTENAKNAMAW